MRQAKRFCFRAPRGCVQCEKEYGRASRASASSCSCDVMKSCAVSECWEALSSGTGVEPFTSVAKSEGTGTRGVSPMML